MQPTCSIFMTGDKEVRVAFDRLEGAAQSRISRDVVKAGAAVVAVAEKAAAPHDSGLMDRAIGRSALRPYEKVIFQTVGVRRGFLRAVTHNSGGRLKVRSKKFTATAAEETLRDPAYYINVVTSGRKTVVAGTRTPSAKGLFDSRSGRFFGKTARSVPPNPFISQAFAQAQGPALAAMQSAAETGVASAVTQ